MAEAAIAFAVLKLSNLLIQKAVNFPRDVEEQVKWLKDELKRMQCFLKDAAQKQAKDESVHNWISEIRKVAQDAEDAVEIFILKVENARRSRGLLGRWASFPIHVYRLNKVKKEIESIRKRLEAIDKSRERYGIQDLVERVDSCRRSDDLESRRELAYWQMDKDVVGLEKDVELLLEKVILDERKLGLSIATIEGMGGIGKSTLARIVYNNGDVADRFRHRAWVVVSSEFRPREIMKKLILQLLEPSENKLKMLETIEKLELPNLQQMLHERLQGKRYLIVLDDMWEDAHWEALTSAFPDEDKGSRLLLTSRNRLVTKYTRYAHKMKVLDLNESWELFLKKALIDNTDGECPEELENIGKEIMKKCNGLPLAISMVGGLLVKQTQSKNEWEKVLKGINSHLVRSGSIVSAILELSYHNLPSHLKPCFLHLSFFREDATISSKQLVQVWIAQDLVPQKGVGGEEKMEDIARGYLDGLINRNMVQVKDMSIDGRVKTCHIHDLIRELSITKAKEEISFEILRGDRDSQSSHKPRHRAMYYSGERLIDYTNQNKYLRSLFIYGYVDGSPSSYWKSFQLLRILDLGDCLMGNLPDIICGLIELRYLGLRLRGTVELPHLLCKLKNLQVLELRNSKVILPTALWKMDRLRHLKAFVIMWGMPLKTITLKNFQTLSYVRVLKDGDFDHVTQMTNLCKLGIQLIALSDASKLFTSLAALENLAYLNLRTWCSPNIDGLGNLNHLTKLKLQGNLTSLPNASNFPPNLSYLSLTSTWLCEDPMPVLEKLPKLLYLKLDQAYYGREIVISHDGFPRLKVLELHSLSSLTNIQVEKCALSELKRLEIYGCIRWESLPEEMRAKSNLKSDDGDNHSNSL